MDLLDGQTTEMKGSGAKPYVLKNNGGVFSCNCPAWRNQSVPTDRRTCKHLKKLRGEAVEMARIGGSMLGTVAVLPIITKPVVAKPALLLAQTWDGVVNPRGKWMSEKLDGVRGYWQGSEFISRLGNKFYAPDWFTRSLPKDIKLDGELWMGRGMFQQTVSIVRTQGGKDWDKVLFLVFDLPDSRDPFEQRQRELKNIFNKYFPNPKRHVRLVEQDQCQGVDHLKKRLAEIEKVGGEGVMLREPGSLYEGYRSPTLLRVKSFKDDDLVVLGYTPGKGRHAGRVGALACEFQGKPVAVGTGLSDAQRDNPPPIGSVIVFRYWGLTKAGIPRNPTFVGVRGD